MKFQSILACLALSSIGIPLASAQEREASPAVVNPPLVSPLRQTIRLDGTWDFATDPKGVGDQEKWFQPGTPLPEKTAIQVPGCWEAQGIGGPGSSRAFTPEADSLPLSGSYMGAAWYRRRRRYPRRLDRQTGLAEDRRRACPRLVLGQRRLPQPQRLLLRNVQIQHYRFDPAWPRCDDRGQGPQRRAQRQGVHRAGFSVLAASTAAWKSKPRPTSPSIMPTWTANWTARRPLST